jgi:hypothetical protein
MVLLLLLDAGGGTVRGVLLGRARGARGGPLWVLTRVMTMMMTMMMRRRGWWGRRLLVLGLLLLVPLLLWLLLVVAELLQVLPLRLLREDFARAGAAVGDKAGAGDSARPARQLPLGAADGVGRAELPAGGN